MQRYVRTARIAAAFAGVMALLVPVFASASSSPYSWTQVTSLGSQYWSATAANSTGGIMAAADSVSIATSTNSGVTWATDSIASRQYSVLDMSPDGSHLVAGVYNGALYASSDYGSTWTTLSNAGSKIWTNLKISSDGSHLATAGFNDYLYTSSDSGVTWVPRTALGSHTQWTDSLCMSSDGSILLAGVYGGSMYMSTTSGATWTTLSSLGTSKGWFSASCSYDGSKILLTYDGGAYYSSNTGTSWSNVFTSGSPRLGRSAVSGDGSIIALAITNPGDIYTSLDGGSTWTDQTGAGTHYWGSISLGGNGSTIVAGVNPGYLYVGIPSSSPTVSVTSPLAASATSSTMTIAASASGSFSSTIAGVTFYVDGVAQGSEITSAPYQISFDTTATTTGTHTVFAVARDNSNNYATSSPVSFTVDNNPPIVSVSAPLASEATSSTMTLAATASDADSGIAGVTFYVNGVKQGSEDTTAPYSVSFNTTATSTGPHTVFAVARDNAGNHATSTTITFTVDNVAPTISLIAPLASEATSSTVTLAANASDANSGVAGVKFYIDGIQQGSEVTSAPYALSWDSTATTSGSHTVFAVARDIAGNHATSTVVTFSVGNAGQTPLSVSAIPAPSGASVTWTTGNPASSRVWFGVSTSYSTSTAEFDTSPRVTSHTVAITGLPSCALFHYVVVGKDAFGNYATSSDHAFYTTGCTGGASITASNTGAIATSTGGTLSQGAITVSVPASFSTSTASATFEANQLDPTAFFASAGSVSGMTAAGSGVFNLKALATATTTVTSFSAPITVTLSYASGNVSGLTLSSLWIYRYDGSSWYPLSSCVVNTSLQTVSCTTTNFSDFAIFGDPASSSSGGSNNAPTVSYGSNGPIFTGTAADLPGYVAPHAQADAVASSTVITGSDATTSSQSASLPFTKNLYPRETDAEVRLLQKYLNAHGFTLAASGLGSPGDETDYFGVRTELALARFQQAHAADILAPVGLAQASGIFGPSTRAYANLNL